MTRKNCEYRSVQWLLPPLLAIRVLDLKEGGNERKGVGETRGRPGWIPLGKPESSWLEKNIIHTKRQDEGRGEGGGGGKA